MNPALGCGANRYVVSDRSPAIRSPRRDDVGAPATGESLVFAGPQVDGRGSASVSCPARPPTAPAIVRRSTVGGGTPDGTVSARAPRVVPPESRPAGRRLVRVGADGLALRPPAAAVNPAASATAPRGVAPAVAPASRPGRPVRPRWAGAGPAPLESGAESPPGEVGESPDGPDGVPRPPPSPRGPPKPDGPRPGRLLPVPRIPPPAAPIAPPARAAPPLTLPPTRPSVAAPSLTACPAAARTPAPTAADSASAATISISAHGAIAASAKIVIAAMTVPADDGKLPFSESPASAAFPANASTISTTGLRITNRNNSRASRLVHPDRGGQIDAASATGKNRTVR